MRIAFDVAQTCVDKAGCGWYADALVRAMVKLSPKDEFLLYHHFDWWHNAETEKGTFLSAPNTQHPFLGLSAAEGASRWNWIRRGAPLPGRPHVVHSTSFQAPKLRKSTRLIFTIFDTSFWIFPEFTTETNRLACQTGTLDALDRADGFIFISQNARDEFEKLFPGWLEVNRRPYAITPLGPKEPVGKHTQSGGNSSPAFWLAVGSLEPRKNYDSLLTAVELYWEKSLFHYPLKIAGGSGWKSEALKKRISDLAARGMVTHLGYVPTEELQNLYASALALIFPSWYEGFGLPVIEAMAAGCPVICSDTSSLPEAAGNAALLINPANPDEIVGAMLRLEKNPRQRSEYIERGLVQSSRFSWADTARRTLEFYEHVVRQSCARDVKGPS